MLETIRRYWIGLLLLTMIGIHASIVGLIRYQASLAKLDASCEVELGTYLGYQAGRPAPISMRLHGIVPINHRLKSRQLIELNQAQVRQALEEHLRQIDSKLLTDPYLTDLKLQLLDVLMQTLGSTSIEDLVITEVHEPKDGVNIEFVSRGEARTPRRVVSLQHEEAKRASHHDDEEESHSSDHASSHSSHAKPSGGHH